jgi:hypothetical protein
MKSQDFSQIKLQRATLPKAENLGMACAFVYITIVKSGPFLFHSPVHILIKEGLASDQQNECAMLSFLHVDSLSYMNLDQWPDDNPLT